MSGCACVHMFVSVCMCHGVQIEVRGQPARAGSLLLSRGSQVNTLRSSSLWASAFTFRLLCKHDGLRSQCRSWAWATACICNLSPGRCGLPGAHWLVSPAGWWVVGSVRDSACKHKVESGGGRQPTPNSDFHMHIHIYGCACTHAHMHTHRGINTCTCSYTNNH